MAMTARPSRQPSAGTRRFGYLIAVAVNVAMLYVVNRWPGWEAVPFLTPDARAVIGLVNLSIAVSVLANLVYLVADPRWLKAVGDMATTSVGLLALVRVWQVFPFDFGDGAFDWGLLTRVLLVVGIVGSAIGILVALVTFVRAVINPAR